MDQTAAAERPVLPGDVFEDDHDILRIEAGARQGSHELLQQFLLDLHAAAHGPKNFDEREIVGSLRLEIGIARIEAQVLGIQLDYALELVGRRYARGHEGSVDRVQHGRLERIGLWLADRECYEWHGISWVALVCWRRFYPLPGSRFVSGHA
jgi:hypothetical protein